MSTSKAHTILYVPENGEEGKLLASSEVELEGEPLLLFVEQVLYPSEPTLLSFATHVRGVFCYSARLRGESKREEPVKRNVSVSRCWSTDVEGPVALMVSLVSLNADTREIDSKAYECIDKDMTLEELQRLQSLFYGRSPAAAFFSATKKGSTIYNRPLGDYLRPFPMITPDSLWPHTKWQPKMAVNELCTRIGVKARHCSATALDIGSAALSSTQAERKFWTKMEITKEDEDEVTTSIVQSFIPPYGPFQKKAHSECAACVTFLSEYHDTALLNAHPELYHATRSFLEEYAAEEDENLEKEDFDTSASTSEQGALVLSNKVSSITIDEYVPEDIKRPSLQLWETYSEKSKIDLFGNGMMLKSIVKPGIGVTLGVSCTVRAWLSVVSEEDDGLSVTYISNFEELTVGALNLSIPVPVLCSMRIGEASYFWLHPNIVMNPNRDYTAIPSADSSEPGIFQTQTEHRPYYLIAIYIPSDTNITFASTFPVACGANSTLARRIQMCADCDAESVVLFKNKHYKIALDFYQIGLKELSIKNDRLFKHGYSVLLNGIEWTEELEPFKKAYIRNRLGAAACCLYIDSWPHHNTSWKHGDSAVEEGVLACDAVLRLEPNNFVALRRKSLLLIKGRSFDTALQTLEIASKCPEATEPSGLAQLKSARDELERTQKKDKEDSLKLARKIFSL